MINSIDNTSDNVNEEASLREYNLRDFLEVNSLCKNFNPDKIQAEITRHLNKLCTEYSINYKVLFLFDEYTPISGYEANKIYNCLNGDLSGKDILLVLSNGGGSIEPAYLISQTCKKKANKKFIVCVPRRAKSAATLLSLGADEIHMGLMSELGPIDPQIRQSLDEPSLPALGLGHSLEYISKLVSKYPAASLMFAKYLSEKLEPGVLGYFERVSESAVQYAERLLGQKKLAANETPKSVAEKLVYHYKDHGFVIDIEEARSMLGDEIIKVETLEYQFANEVYSLFDAITFLGNNHHKKLFTYVGDIKDGLKFINSSLTEV